MRLSGARTTLRRGFTAVAALVLLTLAPGLPHAAPETAATETRALWVLRTSLGSPESITALVGTAREHGFNTLLVQVRGRGDAYFSSSLEPRAAELLRQPETFDPLATVLAKAHDAGLRVHAWVNVNLVSSAVRPADRAYAPRAPSSRVADGAARPRAGALEGAGRESGVCRQARALDARPDDGPASQQSLEGLYTSPILPAAADHVNAVVRDLVTRYAVDGVHLDYARYPTERFDYSRGAIRAFRDDVRPQLTAAVRREVDGSGGRGSARLSGHVSRRVEGVSHLAPDGARRSPQNHGQGGAPGRARHRRHRAGHSGRSRPPPAGLGRMAAGGPRRRRVPDGLHARTRADSPSRLPPLET